MTTSMKPFSRSSSLFLIFLVLHFQGEETINVQGRITKSDAKPSKSGERTFLLLVVWDQSNNTSFPNIENFNHEKMVSVVE